MIIADYVASDSSGKVNMIGGGLGILGAGIVKVIDADRRTPIAGTPHGLFVSVGVGPEMHGTQAVVEMTLEYLDSTVVQLPPPAHPDGDLQEVRITQTATFSEPDLPEEFEVPAKDMLARNQWVLMFPAGLTLEPGLMYQWRVTVDGVKRNDWTERFYVADAFATATPLGAN